MKSRIGLVAALLLLVAGTAGADTLKIPPIYDPPNSPEGVPRPVRGMTMDAVLARFGEPAERRPSVGEPPITRWIYPRYTVYFEHHLVLHTVVLRPGQRAPGGS